MAINKDRLKKFKYFLECYFNPSAYYSELDNLIEDFNKSEIEDTILGFREELKYAKSLDESEYPEVKEFIREHGMRNMPLEKVKWFIEYLNEKIEN